MMINVQKKIIRNKLFSKNPDRAALLPDDHANRFLPQLFSLSPTLYRTQQANQAFSKTLALYLKEFGKNLKSFHLSELLREIACYHRHDIQEHNTLEMEESGLPETTLFLYEKSLILCPFNENLPSEFKIMQDMISNYFHKTDFNAPEQIKKREERNSHLLSKIKHQAFYRESIKEYLQSLQIIFHNDVHAVLADILIHLAESNSVKTHCQKYMTPEAAAKVLNHFQETAWTFREKIMVNNQDLPAPNWQPL